MQDGGILPQKKPLSRINEIAKINQRKYPVGSTERAQWDEVFKLSDEGDARTLSDDPSVKEEKRESRTRPSK